MLHPCARGLRPDAVQDIAAAMEVLRCQPGECVHRCGETVTAVYLIIHGRLKVTLVDMNGRVVMQRYQGAGGQVGGVSAALAEPSPIECVAEDPSTLLRI